MTRPGHIDLSQKAALVTGGSKGMGLGIAQAFVACGAKVAICANDQPSLDAAAKELGAGDAVLAFHADVSDGGRMREVVQ